MNKYEPYFLLRIAIYIAGSKLKLSREIGVSKASVYLWSSQKQDITMKSLKRIKDFIDNNLHRQVGA